MNLNKMTKEQKEIFEISKAIRRNYKTFEGIESYIPHIAITKEIVFLKPTPVLDVDFNLVVTCSKCEDLIENSTLIMRIFGEMSTVVLRRCDTCKSFHYELEPPFIDVDERDTFNSLNHITKDFQ